jgi:hypothetical protein
MSQVPDLTRRCETLGTVESRLVLVLVTDGAEYFKDHPEYAGGAYSFPLIGVIALDSVPEVMHVGTGIDNKWNTWIEKHRTIAQKGICHMKSRPGGRSGSRVPRKEEDIIFMYRVSHSINLEAHSITVRFVKGSMGFIANGLQEIIQKL